MTTQEKIESIRKACIASNPSILDLEFGCNMKNYRTGQYLSVLQDDVFDQILHWNWEIKEARLLKREDVEIIGRPIRLADVLHMLDTNLRCKECNGGGRKIDGNGGVYECHYCGGDRYDLPEQFIGTCFDTKDLNDYWNLLKDDLTLQSEETIDFIHSLIETKQ